jgi:murein DD-endopeptidase MepM/ murein hydrolase activator NlpD
MRLVSSLLLLGLSFACASQDKVGFTVSPGEVRWLEVHLAQDHGTLTCRDQVIKSMVEKKVLRAIIVESYFSDLKPFDCVVRDKEKVLKTIHFTIVDKEYKAEQLKVDPKRIKLSAKNEKRAAEEQLVLNRIYAASEDKFLFSKPFEQPIQSLITSVYGIKRVYNKAKKGQHLGTDFRAAIGDKINAANDGKIVFAGDLFYTGWTVIIDHGMDIFTVYGHLSKTLVKDGQLIKKGELIGLSGDTGRVSGPHLHWGVKVQGQYIDGASLISETDHYLK